MKKIICNRILIFVLVFTMMFGNSVITLAQGRTTSLDASDDIYDIPVSALTATAGSEENNTSEGAAELALDNNINTMWHTDWDGTERSVNWIQFEIEDNYTKSIDGLRYLPRTNAGDKWAYGVITQYEIVISNDGKNWKTVATGTWENNAQWKLATFDAVNAKYVKLISVDSTSDPDRGAFTSAVEIRLISTDTLKQEETDLNENSNEIPTTMYITTAGSTQSWNSTDAAIDGKVDTYWEAEWEIGTVKPEALWYQIELTKAASISEVRYYPRWETAQGGENGFITAYRLEVSDDGKTWEIAKEGKWKKTEGWKIAKFDEEIITKYVRLIATETYSDTGNNSNMSIAEIRLMSTTDDFENDGNQLGTNLAFGKKVTANGSEVKTLGPEKAVDGDLTSNNSRWSSPNEDGPHWLQIDLGANHDIRTVRILWEARKATCYRIQISNDSIDWNDAKVIENRPEKLDDIIALEQPAEARYVRLYIDDFTVEDPDENALTWNTISVYEMEIYNGIYQEDTEVEIDSNEISSKILAKNATANSEQLPVAWVNDGGAAWAFDEEIHGWHSRWMYYDQKAENEVSNGKPSSANPIWIQTGFDESLSISHMTYLARKSGKGNIKDYMVSIANLENPEATPKDSDFRVVKSGTLECTTDLQKIKFDAPVKATHIRLTATSVYQGFGADGTDLGDGYVAAQNIKVYTSDEEDLGENITQKIISGEFSYLDFTGDVSTYTYNYNESWFQNSSYEYQHQLVKMSLRMAMAAGDVRAAGEEDGAQNIKALMKDLGFKYSEKHSHYPAPEHDTIGYAIGSKEIVSSVGEKSTLIAVAIRGSGYGLEWGGNFRVGNEIDHKGFRLAADQVIKGLEKYIETNSDEFQPKIKVWICGFSRAGATANLVAAYLDDGFIEQVSCEDVYAFCFECPQNTTNNQAANFVYSNIVNIINPLDLVTKVAMSKWGFRRFGQDYFLPSSEVTEDYKQLKLQMAQEYNLILVYQRRLLELQYLEENISEIRGQASALDDFVHEFSIGFGPQSYYAESLEEDIVAGIGAALGSDNKIENLGEIINVVPILAEKIVPVLLVYKFADFQPLSAIDLKLHAHYMELCMAWLDSLDGLHEEDYLNYRKIFVNGTMDVEVYKDSELVGSIVNDIPQNLDGVVTYIDGNGQKVIVLPSDCEYNLQLVATDVGNMTYTVTEYDMCEQQTEKVVSYCEVPVIAGRELQATIENLEEVTDAKYILNDEYGKEIPPTIVQTDDEVKIFAVSVNADEGGSVIGGGHFVNGKFIKVTAEPEDNYLFAGWYFENDLISEEQEYRLLVDKNMTLTARFIEKGTSETDSDITRIYGSTRYETSYAIATTLKEYLGLECFDTVILANGNNFPDALAGSYLASVKDAPILMAREKNKESLYEFIKNNLASGGTIYVLGGTGAVPDSVLNGLSGYNVKRLAGQTRYETNLLILEEIGVTNEDILVCTGKDFADSLSASATGKPILLLNNKEITDGQKVFLEKHRGNRYYIVGGSGAISQNMEKEIAEYGIVERVYGKSRFETSIAVAEKFFDKPEKVVLAYARNFPDGLCGGPLANKMDSPLILTAAGKEEPARNYVSENNIQSGKILGGEGVLPTNAVKEVFRLTENIIF